MKRGQLAFLVLVAVTLACNQALPTTPTVQPTATRLVTIATRVHEFTATSQWMATVSKAVVNVRAKPGGAVIGSLRAGDFVEIVACVEMWCEIVEPAGFIWRGCLSDNPDKLKCEAR